MFAMSKIIFFKKKHLTHLKSKICRYFLELEKVLIEIEGLLKKINDFITLQP